MTMLEDDDDIYINKQQKTSVLISTCHDVQLLVTIFYFNIA